MKKPGKYAINPAPLALIVANPKRKGARRVIKRRNPIARRRARAGVFVIRAPRKNPAVKTIDLGNNERVSRGVIKERDGTFTALGFSRSKSNFKTAGAAARWLEKNSRKNPMKIRRRKAKKRRNPLSNLGRFAKKRRGSSRRRRKISRNPTMSKKTRRRGKSRRSRNPISRRGARRSGRRSSRRMRNPMPGVVRELFGADMLSVAGGVVASNVGTTMIMNRLVAGDPATGARPFNLPGVDYSMLGNPQTAGTFYAKNAWILALYKLAIGGGAGYLLRNQSPRFSRGLMIGTVATAVSDVLRNTGVLSPTGTLAMMSRGTGRYFGGRNGVGAYTPGVPSIFTGPAGQFLQPGVPMARRGAGAIVNSGFMRKAEMAAPNPFSS